VCRHNFVKPWIQVPESRCSTPSCDINPGHDCIPIRILAALRAPFWKSWPCATSLRLKRKNSLPGENMFALGSGHAPGYNGRSGPRNKCKQSASTTVGEKFRKSKRLYAIDFIGGADEDRTRDLLTASPADRIYNRWFLKMLPVSERSLFLISSILSTMFDFQAAILLLYAVD
jgi:hypothetical protein